MKLDAKVSVKVNTGLLNKQAGKILSAYAAKLDPILDEQFSEQKWTWTERITRRRNGQEVGSPRDIIDTGELLRSKVGPKSSRPTMESSRDPEGKPIRVRPNGVRRYWVWDTPYAEAVKNGTSSTMPRNWIAAALAELPFRDYVVYKLSTMRTR